MTSLPAAPSLAELRTAVRVLQALGLDPATPDFQAAQYLCVAGAELLGGSGKPTPLGRRVRDLEDAAHAQERRRQWRLTTEANLQRRRGH